MYHRKPEPGRSWPRTINLARKPNAQNWDTNGVWTRHRGFAAFTALVTYLRHPSALNIGYQPTAIGNTIFSDSRDDLLHGVLTRRLGTCTSLPVLFVALGRRLG